MHRLICCVSILGLLITDWSMVCAQTSINGSSTSPISISSSKPATAAASVATASTQRPSAPSAAVTKGGSIGTSMSGGNLAASSANPAQSQNSNATGGSNVQATSAPFTATTTTTTQPTVNPVVGQQIVNSLLSSFVPAAPVGGIGAGAGAGPLGMLPGLSRISGPLTDLITSNGTPKADDVNQILKALPDMAVMASMAKMFGGAASKSANGQQPAASNFSNFTPQQINDMISGAAPLPPMNSLPQEYVNIVLSGGTLPGLTLDQTQALKARYMEQMFGGGGGMDSLFGQGGSPQAPSASSGSMTPTNQSINTNQSISGDQSISSKAILSGNAMQELQNLDLSRLPPDVLQGFMKGETPDLSKIPQDFLRMLISKSPQLFANIVSAELQRKISNQSISDQYGPASINDGLSPASSKGDQSMNYDKSIPYDVNTLDRKADISMYRQDEDDHKATMYTAIVLGVVGLLTVVLIGALCWRRQRRRRRQQEAVAGAGAGIVEQV